MNALRKGQPVDDPRRLTFGHLVAEIAGCTAVLELRRADLALWRTTRRSPTKKFGPGRAMVADAEADCEAAIAALNSAIGVTPDELEQLGPPVRESTAAAEQGAR